MADRINRNLRWVKRKLDQAGMTDVIEPEILDAMSRVELKIMERSGVVKRKDSITFDSTPPHDAGQYSFNAGIHRLLVAECPSTWVKELKITNDPSVFVQLKAENPEGTQPVVVLAMNDQLYFWPIPVNGQSISLYSIAQPATEYGQAEGSGDPSVDWHWDTVLRLGALADITGREEDEARFKRELLDELHRQIQQASAPLEIDHSIRRLGF